MTTSPTAAGPAAGGSGASGGSGGVGIKDAAAMQEVLFTVVLPCFGCSALCQVAASFHAPPSENAKLPAPFDQTCRGSGTFGSGLPLN